MIGARLGSPLIIGKNKDTSLEKAYLDYNFCINECFQQADYIAVNISSPNTKNLRNLKLGHARRTVLNLVILI